MGLVDIDAHSVAVASSLHYDLSDLVDGPLVKKSIRAFWILNKRMLVAPPEEELAAEGWQTLRANMGNRGRTRSAAEAQMDEAEELEALQHGQEDEFPIPNWTIKGKHKNTREYGLEMLDWCGEDRYRNWMFQTSVDLWHNENLETSYNQVKYVVMKKSGEAVHA